MRRFTNSLPMLLAMLSVPALVPGCADTTSTKGQQITCTTNPDTGAVLECAPGPGSGSSANTCRDIDEDGDGEPHDADDDNPKAPVETPLMFAPKDGSDDTGVGDDSDDSNDSDGDGIPDADDCDEHNGEDDDSSDLPYDIRPQLGATTAPIADAFASKGAAPAAIVSVTMEGGSWRLAELQAGTPFIVTQDDCDHPGNRDIGRDRVFVTWRNAVGGATETDHLDIRYCK